MPSETVEAGEITLSGVYTKVVVGLSYRYKLKPMRFDSQFADGTTKGSVRKVAELVLSFLKSGNVEYGRDVENLSNIDWRTTEAYGEPPALYTGDKTVVFDGGFDAEDSILITGNDPLPCTLRCMVLKAHFEGR
jgi:hypothetical protein